MRFSTIVLALLLASCASTSSSELSVLAWNVWHGGREDGEVVGPRRVVEVIRSSGADLVAMQETYGSGELFAEALGFHLHPRGTNVSIHSRFPVLADVSVFEEFQVAGAVVELPDGSPLAFYSIWLPYDGEIWEVGTREGRSAAELEAACASSARDLRAIVAAIPTRLAEAGFAEAPVVLAGDFNSMSHLDWTEAERHQFGHSIAWETSRVATDAGFRDAYRARHPDVDRLRDRTWTPRFPEQEQDRIDFVYDAWPEATVAEARVVDEHPERFPSDHAAVLVRYALPRTTR